MSQTSAFRPLNPREYLVLLSLVDDARYGYGIVRAVDEQSGGDVQLDPANLYRILKRLIRDGLVIDAGYDDDHTIENERRRYYRLTKLGLQVVTTEAGRLARLTRIARDKRLIAVDPRHS